MNSLRFWSYQVIKQLRFLLSVSICYCTPELQLFWPHPSEYTAVVVAAVATLTISLQATTVIREEPSPVGCTREDENLYTPHCKTICQHS